MKRVAIALTLGTVAALYTVWYQAHRAIQPSDFALIWWSATAWRDGLNPYDVGIIGPNGSLFRWDWPMLYPFPAVLVGLPFSLLPLWLAEAVWVALGVGGFAWALLKRCPAALWLCLSLAFFVAIDTAQWSPILTAAAVTPALGWLLIAKPSIGLALFVAYPSRLAMMGCAVLGLLSIIIWPGWVLWWLPLVREAHHTAPWITFPGGFLLLLAAFRWRRPEARLLVALAVIPHTHATYEVLLLALVIQTYEEGAVLVGLMLLQLVALAQFAGGLDADALYLLNAKLLLWFVYLPCLGMVLRRPNEGRLFAWAISKTRFALSKNSTTERSAALSPTLRPQP